MIEKKNTLENFKSNTKAKFAAASLTALLSTGVVENEAEAQWNNPWFTVTGNVQINPDFVRISVYNNSFKTMICRGNVYGQAADGQWLNTWINNYVLRPNEYLYGTVSRPHWAPLINGNADIECMWSR